MPRLVVVSNRVSSPTAAEAAAGGLAVGLKAALESEHGLWFGWSGDVRPDDTPLDENDRVHRVDGADDSYDAVMLDLGRSEYSGFYEQCANRGLWPLLHSRLDLATFSRTDYATYRHVNKLFCDRLLPELEADDVIWAHDYHLFLVGRELRRNGVTAALGFFLHTPFPPAEMFLAVPWWRELIDGLLAFDVVGFQTRSDVRNFMDVVERELDGQTDENGSVEVGEQRCRAAAFPIGIDTAGFADMAAAEVASGREDEFGDWATNRALIIGVDRLDYSKGLHHRFQAFELFLEDSPEHRGRVAFLQIAAPSREDVPEYAHMREELETRSGHINGRFSDLGWVPLRYINQPIDQKRLAALYRLSRVGLITPLKDGMNLVAKEYVAAQDRDDPGMLILSRFSGAAEELQDALIVNPYDIAGVADAIKAAIEMPLDERRHRHERLFARLCDNTIHDWSGRFLKALVEHHQIRRPSETVNNRE